RDLQDALLEQGMDARDFPLVFQYNKQDLPEELILPAASLDEALNFRGAPGFPADALRGGGVFETLRAVTTLVLQRLAQRPPAP
ncbi:MAG TPA: gliding-motility protein MglA, partial [Gemmatimonadales bacterium]